MTNACSEVSKQGLPCEHGNWRLTEFWRAHLLGKRHMNGRIHMVPKGRQHDLDTGFRPED